MTDYRAKPEDWAAIEELGGSFYGPSCLLELRARVEALEANTKQWRTDHLRLANTCASMAPDRLQFFSDLMPDEDDVKPTSNSAQTRSSLVERVGNRMPLLLDGRVDDASARAAIREVAQWLREQSPVMHRSGQHWGEVFDQEAER